MNHSKKINLFLLATAVFFAGCGCTRDTLILDSSLDGDDKESFAYKTKNVVIVVVDGPRFSETWGDPMHRYIPNMANSLAKEGVVYANFYNNGVTFTNPGHTAISTGNYQKINNSGKELPKNPSIFHYYLEAKNTDRDKTWIIASKDKLAVLADCQNYKWKTTQKPSTDCGVNGLGTGYRADSITFEHTMQTLKNNKPNLLLINFRQPDYSGHSNNWEGYLNGIRSTDEYVYKIWRFLQEDANYSGTTTLFVTNDHGRHLDGYKDGFKSHGDGCEGCRHINLFAAGPDFRKGIVTNIQREQIDISATIAELLQFKVPTGKGKVLKELFVMQKWPY